MQKYVVNWTVSLCIVGVHELTTRLRLLLHKCLFQYSMDVIQKLGIFFLNEMQNINVFKSRMSDYKVKIPFPHSLAKALPTFQVDQNVANRMHVRAGDHFLDTSVCRLLNSTPLFMSI